MGSYVEVQRQGGRPSLAALQNLFITLCLAYKVDIEGIPVVSPEERELGEHRYFEFPGDARHERVARSARVWYSWQRARALAERTGSWDLASGKPFVLRGDQRRKLVPEGGRLKDLKGHCDLVDGQDVAAHRQTSRAVAAGRRAAAALGAFPWALAEDGRLPPQWWRLVTYSEALARWGYVAA